MWILYWESQSNFGKFGNFGNNFQKVCSGISFWLLFYKWAPGNVS